MHFHHPFLSGFQRKSSGDVAGAGEFESSSEILVMYGSFLKILWLGKSWQRYIPSLTVVRIPLAKEVLLDTEIVRVLYYQEIIKVREWIPHIGPLDKVIRLKLFLDIVPSSFADITRALRGCFRGGSGYVKSKKVKK